MSDSIDRETAMQVARLARIHLSDDAASECQHHLSQVLAYIGKLNEVQLPENVLPFFGATESVNAVRADLLVNSFPREVMLKNSPDTDGEFYRVPPVFK